MPDEQQSKLKQLGNVWNQTFLPCLALVGFGLFLRVLPVTRSDVDAGAPWTVLLAASLWLAWTSSFLAGATDGRRQARQLRDKESFSRADKCRKPTFKEADFWLATWRGPALGAAASILLAQIASDPFLALVGWWASLMWAVALPARRDGLSSGFREYESDIGSVVVGQQ